jgi:PBP1b-binding outer membrane lipoprotein LpoB
MKKMKLFFIAILGITFLTGCNYSLLSTPQKNETAQETVPDWISNPNFIQGKRSAVGFSGVHYKGKSEQKKLAISRAIDEIAMQKKTIVSNQTIRESSKGKLQTSKTQSLQSTNNISLSTKIVEEYYDVKNNKLYVLVVEE